MERAISAVLVTDMVKSTELLRQLGTTDAAALREVVNRIISGTVVDAGGRVADQVGDSTMAVFSSCISAVEATRDIQRRVADYGRRADALTVLHLRIGIAVGDLLFDGERYYGQAIVEAARLEPLSTPGGALVTDLVARFTGAEADDIAFEAHGALRLKGIDEPIDTFALIDRRTDVSLLDLPRGLTPALDTQLVGREANLAELDELWQSTRAGATSIALVSGDPGMGKSSLISSFAASVHDTGALVLFGSSDRELSVPYWAFAQALERAGSLDAEIEEVLRLGKGALAPLFPHRLDEDANARGEVDRVVLFDAVVEVLVRLAKRRPVLLVLDDLHWMTEATGQLLAHIAATAPECRLLVVGLYRGGEVDRRHGLRPLITEGHAGHRVTNVDVSLLTEADVLTMLVGSSDATSPDALDDVASRIHASTDGSPFYTRELLRHLQANGAIIQDGDRWTLRAPLTELPVPDSIRDVVGDRMALLGDDFAETMALAAVAGTNFDAELLSLAGGRSLTDIVEHIEVAEDHRLVTGGDGAGTHRFAHDIVRSSVLSELRSSRRALIHQQLATALEQIDAGAIDELALHWSRAGTRESKAKALEYLLLAAQRDIAAFAWESAVERFTEAISLAGLATGRVDDEVVAGRSAEARLGLAWSKRALGDPGFVTLMGEALDAALTADRPDLAGRAALGSLRPGSWSPEAQNVIGEIVGYFRTALGTDVDDAMRVRLLAGLATTMLAAPNREERLELLGQARELAERLDEPSLRGSVMVAEFIEFNDPGMLEQRAQLVHEMGTVVSEADLDMAFTHRYFRFLTLCEAGRVDDAYAALEEIEPILTATRNYWFAHVTETSRMALNIMRCRPDLEPLIDAHLAKTEGLPVDRQGVWMCHIGARAYQAGRLGDLAPMLENFVRTEQEEAEATLATWPFAVAAAHALAGDRSAALATLDDVGDLGDLPRDQFWLGSLAGYAMVSYQLGHRELATEAIKLLEPFRGRLGLVGRISYVSELVSTALAQAYLTVDRVDDAITTVRPAIEQADAISAPYFQATSRRTLATALVRTGDSAEAEALLDRVLELSETYGFEGESATASRLLATLDAPGRDARIAAS